MTDEAPTLFLDFDGVLHPVPKWLLPDGSVDLDRADTVELEINARVTVRALFEWARGAGCSTRRTQCADRAVD